MVPKIQEMKGVAVSKQGWDLVVDSKKDRLLIELKKSVRGLIMVRATGPIDWPAKDILRCYSYGPLKKEWDINNDQTIYKKKVGVNGYVLYSKTVKRFMIAARDFASNYIQNTESDGTVFCCVSSTNCVMNIPEEKSVVRGETPLSGFIIKPDPEDQNKSICTLINEVDLKGIPEFALRQAMKDQGYQIDKLRKVLPKWKKQFPNDTIA